MVTAGSQFMNTSACYHVEYIKSSFSILSILSSVLGCCNQGPSSSDLMNAYRRRARFVFCRRLSRARGRQKVRSCRASAGNGRVSYPLLVPGGAPGGSNRTLDEIPEKLEHFATFFNWRRVRLHATQRRQTRRRTSTFHRHRTDFLPRCSSRFVNPRHRKGTADG